MTRKRPSFARRCCRASPRHGYQLRALESADIDVTDLVEVRAELATIGRNDEQIETAAARLGLEPNVTSVRWHVIEQDGRAAFGSDSTSDDG